MGAAQDEGVDVNVDQLRQVPSGNLLGDGILQQPFLHQRHQQGTCLAVDGDILFQLFYVLGVDLASYGGLGGDNPDSSVPCDLRRRSGPRPDHAYYGNVGFLLQGLQSIGAGGVAGHHNGLHLESAQKSYNLFRKTCHSVPGFAPIGNPGSVSKVDDFFVGNLPDDLPDHSKSAHTGVKYPDGGVFFQQLFIQFHLFHAMPPKAS